MAHVVKEVLKCFFPSVAYEDSASAVVLEIFIGWAVATGYDFAPQCEDVCLPHAVLQRSLPVPAPTTFAATSTDCHAMDDLLGAALADELPKCAALAILTDKANGRKAPVLFTRHVDDSGWQHRRKPLKTVCIV
jgi:hypothetical protein